MPAFSGEQSVSLVAISLSVYALENTQCGRKIASGSPAIDGVGRSLAGAADSQRRARPRLLIDGVGRSPASAADGQRQARPRLLIDCVGRSPASAADGQRRAHPQLLIDWLETASGTI